jgi:hypothetical protein
MDGRVQIPVSEYIRETYAVNFVAMITEPGPNKTLSENAEKEIIESLKRRVKISVHKHESKLIAIVGHHDCAGNPVDRDIQIKQIHKACKVVGSWSFDVQIIGLWVNENWEVLEVTS